MKVEETVSIITGSTRGIGRALAELLVKEGGKVCLIGRTACDGEKACAELNVVRPDHAMYVKADVSSKDQFKEAFEKTIKKFGKVNFVCNNAGIVSESNWSTMVNVNFGATIIGTYLAAEYLGKFSSKENPGIIVNISSTLGIEPFAFSPVYNGTKAAIIAFTRSCVDLYKLEKRNLRINCLCPYSVDTPMIDRLQSADVYYLDEFMNSEADEMPMTPEEVALEIVAVVKNDSQDGQVVTIKQKATDNYKFAPVKHC